VAVVVVGSWQRIVGESQWAYQPWPLNAELHVDTDCGDLRGHHNLYSGAVPPAFPVLKPPRVR
jgi:hypothetical protein